MSSKHTVPVLLTMPTSPHVRQLLTDNGAIIMYMYTVAVTQVTATSVELTKLSEQ